MPTEAQKRWNDGPKGNTPSWERPRKLTSAQRQEISYLRYEGYSLMELAAQFNVSSRTIHNMPPVERP